MRPASLVEVVNVYFKIYCSFVSKHTLLPTSPFAVELTGLSSIKKGANILYTMKVTL